MVIAIDSRDIFELNSTRKKLEALGHTVNILVAGVRLKYFDIVISSCSPFAPLTPDNFGSTKLDAELVEDWLAYTLNIPIK